MDRGSVELLIRESGCDDYKWMSGKDVVVAQWPRFKCMYGCSSYGNKGACPPSVPSVAECREFFGEYEHIAVIHFQKELKKPEDRKAYSRKTNAGLLKLERSVFLAGYQKTFLLFMDECRICEECPGTHAECKNLQLSRPCPEGLGVDVFATVRKIGYPIAVLTDYRQPMNRYAFLMVE